MADALPVQKHYLTLVSAVLCLLTLAISPIAASLFFIQDVALPAQSMSAIATLLLALTELIAVIATSIAQLGYSDLQSPITAVAGASGFVLAQGESALRLRHYVAAIFLAAFYDVPWPKLFVAEISFR